MINNQTKGPILSVNSISNSYDGQSLLKDVSFQLEKGEILCLLGPSGSGKTTLLRLIAGLEAEYSGTILFKGNNIESKPPHKRGFGLMFQEYALFPHKNVEDNIGFGLEMQGLDSEEKRKQVEKMLQLVGLSGFGKRRINELSGGEQQRVALARSLAPEPQLLLLDEPLGSLDRTLRDRLTVEIRSILKALNVTAIFVTHDQNEAFGVSDKIAILKDGCLQQFAAPEEIYRHPINSTVARFLGFTNLFDLSIDQRTNIIESPFGPIATNIGPITTSRDQVLLLRPEGASLRKPGLKNLEGKLIIQGTVKDKRYQGSSYNLTIESNSQLLHFDLPLEPPPPQVNAQIELVIEPDSILRIEKSS
ncbi:ABC transporter ATP-binding protein [Desulforhopalus sp. 52FAK]